MPTTIKLTTPFSSPSLPGSTPPTTTTKRKTIFLSGSTTLYSHEPRWQQTIYDSLAKSLLQSQNTEKEKEKDMEIEIIDPYNDTWDDTWKEEFRNEKFRKQVEWELEGMAGADYNVVAFWGPAPAPISLLELGLLLGNPAKKGKVVVCCPKGYVRRGNVEIVCRRLVGGAAFVEELEDVVGWLVREILGTGDTEKSVEKGEGERDLGGKVGGERESEKRWEAKWNKAEETSDGALF